MSWVTYKRLDNLTAQQLHAIAGLLRKNMLGPDGITAKQDRFLNRILRHLARRRSEEAVLDRCYCSFCFVEFVPEA